jgi:hypothetical protein
MNELMYVCFAWTPNPRSRGPGFGVVTEWYQSYEVIDLRWREGPLEYDLKENKMELIWSYIRADKVIDLRWSERPLEYDFEEIEVELIWSYILEPGRL